MCPKHLLSDHLRGVFSVEFVEMKWISSIIKDSSFVNQTLENRNQSCRGKASMICVHSSESSWGMNRQTRMNRWVGLKCWKAFCIDHCKHRHSSTVEIGLTKITKQKKNYIRRMATQYSLQWNEIFLCSARHKKLSIHEKSYRGVRIVYQRWISWWNCASKKFILSETNALTLGWDMITV